MLRCLALLLFFPLSVVGPVSSFAQQRDSVGGSTAVTNALAGKTVRFTSDKYGSGVLYFAVDGRAFIWHPGKIEVSVGIWRGETFRVTMQPGTDQETVTVTETIVVQFPDGTEDNPVLVALSGLFAILDANDMAGDLGVQEVAEGDVIGLEDMKPPCRMCRAEMTFAQMSRP